MIKNLMRVNSQKDNFSPEKKILLTLGILFLVRLGNFIPIPEVNYELVKKMGSNSALNYVFDSSLGFFNLGISSYINASLIIQFLTPIIPYLENLQQEEGESGRQKIIGFTKLLSLVLAIIQASKLVLSLRPYIFNWSLFTLSKLVLFLVTGAIITIWFSELITEKGFGNGTSILICLNLFESLPIATKDIFINISQQKSFGVNLLIIFGLLPLSIVVSLLLQSALKEINIISSKQFTSKFLTEEIYCLPFRLNQSGVMALVFASTALYLLGNFASQLKPLGVFYQQIPSSWLNILYSIISCLLIVFFSFSYSSIFVDRKKLSDELRKMCVTIPKVRPGKPTSKYLKKVLNRVYLIGGITLGITVSFSDLISVYYQAINFRSIGISSLFILVGTLMDGLYKYEESKNSPGLESNLLKDSTKL